jgi:hypothetical protein
MITTFGGQRTAHCADEEEPRAHQQCALAPDAIGDTSTEQRSESRTGEQQATDDRGLPE